MKFIFQLVFVSCLILYTACERDSISVATLDYPIDFNVSKGTYVDRISLSWVGPPKAERFEILRADDSNADYKIMAVTENQYYTDSSSHIVNQKYYYKVRVFNSDQVFSDYTNFDYGYVSEFRTPAFSEISSGTGNNYVTLNWSNVNGSDQYFIYRSPDKVDYTLLDSTHLLSYMDSKNIVSGKTYYYKIKSFNKLLGYSDFSRVDSGYIYQAYSYISSFGNFTLASYIDFDSKGNIYVVDATAGLVQEFDRDYNYIRQFISMPGAIFRGIKFIGNDNVIIAESNKGMVGFFNSDGLLIKEKKVSNSGILRQVTTDLSNNIYVTDLANASIIKLDSNGDVIKSWKSTYVEATFGAYSIFYYNNSLMLSSLNNSLVAFCSLDGEWMNGWYGMINAACIAMDSNSDFYFACYNRIVKTDVTGKILALIILGDNEKAQTVNVCSNGDVLITNENNPSRVCVYRQIL